MSLLTIAFTLCISCSDDDNPVDQGNNTTFTPRGMVKIAAAGKTFQMGDAAGLADEAPVHSVSFTKDYWMDTTEVTQGKYNALMKQFYTAYTTPSWHAPYGVGDDYPAYEVYWGDAVLYCNALSRRDGLDTVYTYSAINGTPGNLCELENVVENFAKNGYRLPTEAEWEYACRAGSTTDFFWGKEDYPFPETPGDSLEVNRYAVWHGNSWQFGAGEPQFGVHPVGSTTANGYGLYDMAGNVYEWCNDWYGEYSDTSAVDPHGPSNGDWHSVRGGSWGSYSMYLRSANRTFMVPDYLYYFIGFRAVLPVQ